MRQREGEEEGERRAGEEAAFQTAAETSNLTVLPLNV